MQTGERWNDKGGIRGLIVPDQWDAKGEVVAVTIQTNQEEIYYVTHNKTGQEMLGFIHKEVEAIGKIGERINGTSMITVKRFRLV